MRLGEVSLNGYLGTTGYCINEINRFGYGWEELIPCMY